MASAEATKKKPVSVQEVLAWGADRSFLCWAWVTLVMFILAVASIMLGIHSVAFDGALDNGHTVVFPPTGGSDPVASKEVGYMFALNWAFYSVIIVPVMVVAGLRVWSSMPLTLRAITEAGMVRDKAFRRMDAADLERRWIAVQRSCGLIFVVIFVAVMVTAMADWWQVVGLPIHDKSVLDGVPLTHSQLEFDWSIACRYESAQVGCPPLQVFGFLAYVLVAGLPTAAAFATSIAALFFAIFACGHAGPASQRWRLVAVPCDKNDRHGGFGNFSDFFNAFLALSITVVIGCLLMIIQNAYLRDGASQNVFIFVFGDANTMIDNIKSADLNSILEFKWVGWLLTPAQNMYANTQTGIGILLFGLTALVTVGASWGLLRHTAMNAKAQSLQLADTLAAECDVSTRTFKKRLEGMNFWPVGWLKQNQMLALMGSLMLSVITYRLLLLPVAFLGLQGGKWLVGTIFQRKAKPAGADQPE